MANSDDRRDARRILFQPPVSGELSHVAVKVLDLSTSGARVQHDAPLTFQPGKRFVLDFVYDGERLRLSCAIARSRLEMTPRGKVYTSGVRFTDVDNETHDRLWGVVGLLAIDVLAHAVPLEADHDFAIVSA